MTKDYRFEVPEAEYSAPREIEPLDVKFEAHPSRGPSRQRSKKAPKRWP
jgi:hypothetical protein